MSDYRGPFVFIVANGKVTKETLLDNHDDTNN